MKKSLSSVIAIMVVSSIAWFGSQEVAKANCIQSKSGKPGEVYLLRGLANIFSRGLDRMSEEFARVGLGNCVTNHHDWKSLADDIIARSKSNQVNFPVIIIGHSLGANAAPMMATRIGEANVPVAYVVMLDPVLPTEVGRNVKEIVNWYIQKKGKDKILSPLPDFKGRLVNLDVTKYGVDHFDIDKSPLAHKTIIEHALKLSSQQAKK